MPAKWIYGWQLLGFVLLLIIVIGTNSDILGAPPPPAFCPNSFVGPPRWQIAFGSELLEGPVPSWSPCPSVPQRSVAYTGLLILEEHKKGNIFSTDRLLLATAAVFDYCPLHRPGSYPVNCYWQRKQQRGTNWALNLRLCVLPLLKPSLLFFFPFSFSFSV